MVLLCSFFFSINDAIVKYTVKQLNTDLDLSQKETAKQLQIVKQLNASNMKEFL